VTRVGRLARLAAAAALVLPTPSAAQSRVEIAPSLTLMQLYDDNLFARPGAGERDLVLRLTPRLDAAYRSPAVTASAHYTLDAERFQEHRDLDAARARQEAAIGLRMTPTRRLDLDVSAAHASTLTPGELNLLTGIETGRAPARRTQAAGALSLRLGTRTSATVQPGFIREQVEGGPAVDTVSLTGGMERRLGPSAQGRLRYRVRRFSGGGDAATLSHAVTAAWSGRLSRTTELELEAGPRRTGRQAGAELALSLRRHHRGGELALAYVRTEATVLGVDGPVTAEGVSVSLSRALGRSLRFAMGPSVFATRGAALQATVYRGSLDLSWRLARALRLSGGYQYSLQRGGAGADVRHNVLLLSLASRY
jgi:hypothetical protein